MMRALLILVAVVGCKRDACPNGGDARVQCLRATDVQQRVEATAAKRSELAAQLPTLLADHPFTCGSSSSDQFKHPSIQKLRTELADRVKAAGANEASVTIGCGSGGAGAGSATRSLTPRA